MGGREEIRGIRNRTGFVLFLFLKCLTQIYYNLLSQLSKKNRSLEMQPSGASWQKLEGEFGKPQARWEASFLLNGCGNSQGTFHSSLMMS